MGCHRLGQCAQRDIELTAVVASHRRVQVDCAHVFCQVLRYAIPGRIPQGCRIAPLQPLGKAGVTKEGLAQVSLRTLAHPHGVLAGRVEGVVEGQLQLLSLGAQ